MSFTKEDLRTCDVIEYRNGELYMVMRGTGFGMDIGKSLNPDDPTGWITLGFNDEMRDPHGAEEWDAMRIYRPRRQLFTLLADRSELENWNVVFRLAKSMTMQEAIAVLEEHFGCPVEIDTAE